MLKNTCLLLSLSQIIVSCSSLNSDLTQSISHRIEDNRYIYAQTYFSVDVPTIMNSKSVIISEYGLGIKSKRVVVNFGPELPDRAVFTVQVANKELYEEVSHLGSVDIFSSGSEKSIREDFAKTFFGQIFRSLRDYKFDQLLQEKFMHRGNEVTYAVYKDRSDNSSSDPNYNPPEIYYLFYLTEMNNRGVLVWLQIPITDNENDGRSENNFITRSWAVQNDFFNSLNVSTLVTYDDKNEYKDNDED